MFIKKISSIPCGAVLLIILMGGISSYQMVMCHEKAVVVVGNGFGEVAVTGVARIVTASSQLSKVNRGDIIVAPMTDPSWEPAMGLAAGIITDQGDSGCHAALFGKKLGIPVIVGTYNATQKITDGQVVIIDCDKSSVYVEPVSVAPSAVVHKTVNTSREIFLPSDSLATTSTASTTSGYHYSSSSPISCLTIENQGHELKRHKQGHSAKELYAKHYFKFHDYVFDTRSTLNKWMRLGEWALMKAARTTCGPFEVKCIPLSYMFFKRDDKYIASMLKVIASDKYMKFIDTLMRRCGERPGDLEWLARMSHEESINNIEFLSDSEKARLIAEPGEYKKMIEENRFPAAEAHAFMTAGLFVRCMVEEKLI